MSDALDVSSADIASHSSARALINVPKYSDTLRRIAKTAACCKYFYSSSSIRNRGAQSDERGQKVASRKSAQR